MSSKFVERYNAGLANGLGNLALFSLAEKHGDFPADLAADVSKNCRCHCSGQESVFAAMEGFRFNDALGAVAVGGFADKCE